MICRYTCELLILVLIVQEGKFLSEGFWKFWRGIYHLNIIYNINHLAYTNMNCHKLCKILTYFSQFWPVSNILIYFIWHGMYVTQVYSISQFQLWLENRGNIEWQFIENTKKWCKFLRNGFLGFSRSYYIN